MPRRSKCKGKALLSLMLDQRSVDSDSQPRALANFQRKRPFLKIQIDLGDTSIWQDKGEPRQLQYRSKNSIRLKIQLLS